MERLKANSKYQVSRLKLAGLVLVVAFAVVMTQGCCSWCAKHCDFPRTVTIVLGVDLSHCPCPTANCVCPMPNRIKARPGDSVLFINSSGFDVTVTSSVSGFFQGGDSFAVAAGTDRLTKILQSAPVVTGNQVGLDFNVGASGVYCPGLPGPIIDID